MSVRRSDGQQGNLFLREGRLYAAEAPGVSPPLGSRLVTLGVVSSGDVLEALDLQWGDFGRWQLAEALVHLDRTDRESCEPSVRELLVDAAVGVLTDDPESWEFRDGRETSGDLVEPLEVDELLDEMRTRIAAWEELLPVLGGPYAVVRLERAPGRSAELEPEERAVLERLDSVRALAVIASDIGFTLLETGRLVHRLSEVGWVSVTEPSPVAPQVVPPVAPDEADAVDAMDEPAATDDAAATPEAESAPVVDPEPATDPGVTPVPEVKRPRSGPEADPGHEPNPEPAKDPGPSAEATSAHDMLRELNDAHTETPGQARGSTSPSPVQSPAAAEPGHGETSTAGSADRADPADTAGTSRDETGMEDLRPEAGESDVSAKDMPTESLDTAALLRELAALSADDTGPEDEQALQGAGSDTDPGRRRGRFRR
ncbi:MAG: hypothetical protein ACRDYU_07065 [Actinomycetes bacterium]